MHSNKARCALIMLVGTLVILALFSVICVPQRYDLTVGSISPYTINATKDVVDQVTTDEKRRAAEASV